ncbi:MAG: mechanosensitive ion channel family protein [Acidobacteria bacterium]|nr:MAG: mechanosensitive ion channel family protein [Acidobacteriota bacterium]
MVRLLFQAAPLSQQGEAPPGSGILGAIRDAIVRYTGDGGWITWIQVFVVVFAALLLDFTQRNVLARLKKRLERTRTPWDDAILDALTAPISLLIWVLGITLAGSFLDMETQVIYNIITLTLVAAVTWFLLRLIRNGQANLLEASRQSKSERDRLDPSTVEAIGKLLRLTVTITATLIALQQIGVNISAILAFGGIGGIAVGFAAKDLLANFFGGLMIYMDRPFKVGDWIRSPDRNIEGTVESIGWRLTRIRTFDKRPLYLPNSIFSTIAVENPQRMLNRRIYETIGLRYQDMDKMDDITRDVKAMLQNHPEIDTRQTLMVNFNSFGPSSVDFFVYTLTKTTNWQRYHEIKHEILLKIAGIITRHGAEIAFPTSTLHVASLPGQAQPAGSPANDPDR